MKKFAKKFLVAAMACMLAVTTVAPLTAEAAPSVAKSTTIYLAGKNYYRTTYININGLTSTPKITNVKSSKNTVVELYNTYVSSSTSKYDYFNENYTDNTYKSYYGEIAVMPRKTGESKISFKVNGKSLSTTVKVLAYTNPIKTANVLGIKSNGSTNLASKTKTNSSTDLKLSKTVSNGKLTFKAASGWKITGVYFNNYDTGINYRLSSGNGLSSATLYVGKVAKNADCYAYVSLMNTKNGASQTCYYYIND